MLSDELRNLTIWLRGRRKYRERIHAPVDTWGTETVIDMLEELVVEAIRLEAHTRLSPHEAVAERVSIEGIR
jgi:hypothetical protein